MWLLLIDFFFVVVGSLCPLQGSFVVFYFFFIFDEPIKNNEKNKKNPHFVSPFPSFNIIDIFCCYCFFFFVLSLSMCSLSMKLNELLHTPDILATIACTHTPWSRSHLKIRRDSVNNFQWMKLCFFFQFFLDIITKFECSSNWSFKK